MFGVRKQKAKRELLSPISGELLPISEVPDPVFSEKMMGDGFAVKPQAPANQVLAPISGKITLLPASKHAIGIRSASQPEFEILVHIGLDTVELQGAGFESAVELGQTVTAGQALISFDWPTMQKGHFDMSTIVLFTAGHNQSVDLADKAHQAFPAGTAILENL